MRNKKYAVKFLTIITEIIGRRLKNEKTDFAGISFRICKVIVSV